MAHGDRSWSWRVDVTTVVYATGLGASSIALPLLAVDAGYSLAQVGVLTAVSAVAQIVVRLGLGAALRRYPDRLLITLASLLLSMSFFAVTPSTHIALFVLAQAAQGVSRACFWTGMQAHVVRDDRFVTKNLARNFTMANLGLLLGPVAAGFVLEVSTDLALLSGAALGGAASVLSLSMRRLPPFAPSASSARSPLRRRPPVVTGCVAAGVAGAWQGLLGSYMPAVLGEAGHTAGVVGVLVALASAANTTSTAALTRVRVGDSPLALVVSCIAVGVGVGLLGVAAPWSVTAAACLLVSGLGSGILQTLGSSVASESVHPEERGQAIALTGTVRSAAMFGSPLAVAGFLQIAGVPAALGVVGVGLLLPVVRFRRRWR
jgi:MFS family permease